MPITVLVGEDDETTRTSLRLALQADGYAVQLAASAEAAVRVLQEEEIDAVVTDLVMRHEWPGSVGLSQREGMETPPIIVTAYSTIESAVEAMRRAPGTTLPNPLM